MSIEEKANEEVEELIKSGVPIVTLNIFDNLDRITLSDSLKDKIDYTIEEYIELLNEIKTYPEEFQMEYLEALKNADIIDNESIEKQDSFITSLSRNISDESAVDKFIKQDKLLTKEDFVNNHDLLIKDNKKKNLRENNLKFVGEWDIEKNTRLVSYFPIRNTEIDIAIDKFLDYYNSSCNDKYERILKPMILHGLLAALQLFKDGNARYARLIQNISMWKSLNKITNIDMPMPVLYATRQYAAYRQEYRQKIVDIAKTKDNAWEEWFKFNLYRLQDGIWFNKTNIEKLSDHIEYSKNKIM